MTTPNPTPSLSDDVESVTVAGAETDHWASTHSSSSITRDAPTAISESSSIGGGLCCVENGDGTEAAATETSTTKTDKNNNHTLDKDSSGEMAPNGGKDKTGDSSSSLASSVPTNRFGQHNNSNNAFSKKNPSNRSYRYANG